jgi:hypothetical protein
MDTEVPQEGAWAMMAAPKPWGNPWSEEEGKFHDEFWLKERSCYHEEKT